MLSLADERVAERVHAVRGETTVLDLMAGPRWRLGDDLAPGRYRSATTRMLMRLGSFIPSSPAAVLLLHQGGGSNMEFFAREVLGRVAGWLPRESDPTVRVRDPAEHPGVPFAFVAFVATNDGALDALSDGALLDVAAAHAARELEAYQRTLHRNPHRAALHTTHRPGRDRGTPGKRTPPG